MDLRALGTVSPDPLWSDPLSTYVLMGATDWNTGNQNFRKIQNRCFPWSEPALCHRAAAGCPAPGHPAPGQHYSRIGFLWVRGITLVLTF